MNKNPKISIIVPVYNAEKYLRDCLDSIVNQTMKDIEIICINDGSKDSSLTILEEYARRDQRIIVFSQKNSGPAMARNVGLSNANGTYLMFCEADDSYETTMCEEMFSIIHNSNYDFVMCDANIIEIDQNTRSKHSVEYNRLNLIGNVKLTNNIKNQIRTLIWNKIFRMSIVRQFDITFPTGYEMDDEAFILQYISYSNNAFGLNKKLYNYKLLSTSIVSSYYKVKNPQKIFDAIYAYQYAVKKIVSNNNNNNWLHLFLNNKIKWIFKLLDKKNAIIWLDKFNSHVLRYFQLSDLKYYPLLTLSKKKNFKEAYYLYHGILYKNYLNILITKKSKDKKNVYFFGIQIYKRIKTPVATKHYILGIKYHKKNKNTNLSPDISKYIDYISTSLSFEIKRMISTSILHQKTFSGFKNKYQGKDVILVGCGPTVSNYVKLIDGIHVGLNRSFLRKDIKFNHLFVCDKIGIEQFMSELIDYSKKTELFIGDINCGKDFQISESMALKLKGKRYNTGNLMGMKTKHSFTFVTDIETQPLGAFHSVAFQAMQFIMYTNPKRIYLVGIDCGNAGKHFAGTEHNVSTRGEDIDKLEKTQKNEWKQLKEFASIYYPETEIISINPVGLKYLFTDVYTKSFVNEHPEINFKNENILEEK